MDTTENKITPRAQEKQPGLEEPMNPGPVYINFGYKAAEKLAGKVALVTGGDSGIGRAITIHFAREGADVAIVYLDEQEDAEETRRLVEEAGKKCLLLPGDVKSEAFCVDAINRTVEEFGKLNILVNNAAIKLPQKELRSITADQLTATFATNLFAYFYFARAATPHLTAGDSIINTTCVTAFRASPDLLDYSASKAAVNTFTRCWAASLAPQNIRVNAIAPGPVWTPLIVASWTQEEIDHFGEETAMKRAGQPAELAPAYVFLASDSASYITGQVLHINGGELVSG